MNTAGGILAKGGFNGRAIGFNVDFDAIWYQIAFGAADVAIGIFGNALQATHIHNSTQLTGLHQYAIDLSIDGVFLVLRNGKHRQNTNDQNDDHQFNECKTLLRSHGCSLKL